MLVIGHGIFAGITGSNMLTVGDRNINILILTSGLTSGDVVVNEDGSGDALLFENDDTWVIE